MTEFLLELYSEEIPARMQEAAAKEIATKISADAKYFHTPQRIVVLADMPEKQADEQIEKRGPKVGAPEQAVQGFLKSVGLSKVEDAETIEEKGTKYYFYKNTIKGKATAEHLAEVLPKILSEFTWPKSMRWGSGDTRWVRPLHSIIAIFGGKVVPFKFGEIKSGNTTKGHRFLAPEEFIVYNFADYKADLEKRKVILDAEDRKKIIRLEERKIAGHVTNEEDDRLLNEVANLVEYPHILVGEFPKEFLEVPQECLIATMKNNQKYFPRFTSDGKLTNKFIITSNMIAEDGGKRIIAGNERVIKARLSDAKFFWEQDQKQKLEEFLPRLEKVVFHAKVGTLREKAQRIAHLAKFIANIIGADARLAERAGVLCKADLVTGMVGEFAELQGIMGGYYAAKSESPEVARAIKEHYQPAGQDDEIPTKPISVCVALADKIDSLVQLWQAGEKPTGSRDPYGLRRAALGIIRLILENKLKLGLHALIIEASKQGEEGTDEIYAFFMERLKHLMKSSDVRHDFVDAVLGSKTDFLYVIFQKAQILQGFATTATGTNLLACYRRAANILEIEEKKDKTKYAPEPEKSALSAKEEIELFDKLNFSEPIIAQALDKEDFSAAMGELAKLQPAVNSFFDSVMVNAEDKKLRENRLKLLAKIRQFMDLIADFGKIN